MKVKHVRVPIHSPRRNSIRIDPGTEEELKSLARSWLDCPIHPIICRPDMTVIDGHRRLAGLELLGETEVDVAVTEQDLTDAELIEAGIVTAFHRKGLSGYEQWRAITTLEVAHPDRKLKDLADHLQMDPGLLTRIRSVSSCCRAVQESLKAQKITIKDCYEFSRMAEEEQLVELDKRLNGGKYEEIARRGRTKSTSAAAVRLSRIRVPLPTGPVVTVAGEEISLDEGIEALKDALKAMTSARDRGYNARTAQAVFRDVAKAGA